MRCNTLFSLDDGEAMSLLNQFTESIGNRDSPLVISYNVSVYPD